MDAGISSEAPAGNWLRNIFIGPKGIRAGWSALLFLGIALIFVFTGGLLLSRLLPKGAPAGEVLGEALLLAATLGATAIMARIERKKFSSYGFADSRWRKHALFGLAAGFFAQSVAIGLIFASGHFRLGPADGSALQIVGFGLSWGVVFAMVGLFEESMFRGYLQFTLSRGIGFWPAAALMSLLFAFAHTGNSGETPVGIAVVVLAAVFLVLLLALTGSLWLAIGFHAAWDWAETFFYGAPDSGMPSSHHLMSMTGIGNPLWSGGSAGPEGSLFAVVVLLVGIAVCGVVMLRRSKGSLS